MKEYFVDQSGHIIEEDVFRPVIYTSVYGDDLYYGCLNIFLESLEMHGKYHGAIKIVTDRSFDELLNYVPKSTIDRLTYCHINNRDFMNRYNVDALDLNEYTPILHMDSDIVINNDINEILRKINARRQVCVTTEADTYPELANEKIVRLVDNRRIGNWWGLEILRSDASMSEEFFPLINGGVIGFSDHSVFSLVSRLVFELHEAQSHADIAKWFGDQPFLNYVLIKTKLGEYETFRKSCCFSGPSMPFPTERLGFVHFLWARGAEKLKVMNEYSNYLNKR